MSNPSTNLTDKFTTLSEDINTYLQTTDEAINSVTAKVDAGNNILTEIEALLQTIATKMQTAAECACNAAAAMSDVLGNLNNTAPPTDTPCTNASTDPHNLTFTVGFSAGDWTPVNVSYGAEYILQLSPYATILPGSSETDMGTNTPAINLYGPMWYLLEHTFSAIQSGGGGSQNEVYAIYYKLSSTTQELPGHNDGGTYTQPFFNPSTQVFSIYAETASPMGEPMNPVTISYCTGGSSGGQTS